MAIRHNYVLEQDIENSIQDLAAKIAGIGQDASGIVPTRAPVEPQIQQDANNYKQDTGGIIPDRTLASVEKRNDLAMESSIIDRQKLAEYVANIISGNSRPIYENATNYQRINNSPEYQQIMKEAADIANHSNFDMITLGNYSVQEMAELDEAIDEAVKEVMVDRYLPAFNSMIESGIPDIMVLEAAKNLEKKKNEVKAKLKKTAMNKNLKGKDIRAKQECDNNSKSSLPSSSSFANRF